MMFRATVFVFLLCLLGCSDASSSADQEVGSNGEPPKALQLIYQKQFVAEEKNYVLAFGFIHAFLVERQFSVKYSRCFDDVLDVRKRGKGFTCLALQAEQGPPTKTYVRVKVEEVLFNQLDDNNRLSFSVEIYVLDGYVKNGKGALLVDGFTTDVETELVSLYKGR